MNYAEELAYWFLRLNGFFPILNYVVHRGSEIDYSSDCDVLAIRPSNVFEEVGGQENDWCEKLFDIIPISKTIGCVCEVKTGAYETDTILRTKYVKQCINRLGITPHQRVEEISSHLERNYSWSEEETYIFKLLIANTRRRDLNSLFLSVCDIEEFIKSRIEKYKRQKYQDRMLFNSCLFQILIHQNK